MLLPLPPSSPAVASTRLTITLQPPPTKKKPRIQLPPAPQLPRSPKKRARVVSQAFTRKRRCPNPFTATVETQDVPGIPDPPSPQPNNNTVTNDTIAVDHNLDKEFQLYSRAVYGKTVGLYQICETLWVAQGWTQRSGGSSHWYHLERKFIGNNAAIGCSCPRRPCNHKKFMEIYGTEQFPPGAMGLAKDDEVILFLREHLDTDDNWVNYFSVPRSNSGNAKNRAVVIHKGSNKGWGLWVCSRDKGDRCGHIKQAKHHLDMCHTGDPSAPPPEDLEGEDAVAADVLREKTIRVGKVAAVKDQLDPISYLPRLPPSWATLPSDPIICARKPPIRAPPSLLLLDQTSSCPCGQGPRTMYDENRPLEEQDCIIYTLVEAWPSRIQVQRCEGCATERSHHYIGPDGQELGLFNLDNTHIFSHDLLDEYTSAYTSSETPFVAWVTVMSRRYDLYNSRTPFVGPDLFRSAWFAYVSTQTFENDFECPTCGPVPTQVICDGITLAFQDKHLLPSMRPPTLTDDSSPVRASRYVGKQQILPDVALRKKLKDIVKGPRLPTMTEMNLWSIRPQNKDQAAKSREAYQLVLEVDDVCKQLDEVDPSIGSVFRYWFSFQAAARNQVAPDQYKALFLQLAAEESIIQMINGAALELLGQFNQDPSKTNASRLVLIPSLLNVLFFHDGKYPPDLLAICTWIYNQGHAVLDKLTVHQDESHSILEDLDWKKTGCYYSLPRIRTRPKYPSLSHDLQAEPSVNRGAKCSKYYSKYGKRALTGGIMAIWCTHGVSYGFHCIPRGEGRNDVFSALWTRWPKAPEVVIYDFACALGPYCMTREPHFFADTIFCVDCFHWMGHKKCGRACALATYGAVDPRVSELNTSVAESGNGGLSRIRKSVSYMAQERAIVYTKIFIGIWNRMRIRDLLPNF